MEPSQELIDEPAPEDDQNNDTPNPKEEQDYDTPAPLPMNNIEDFEKKYNKGDLLLDTDEFILFSGEEKETNKNVIIKEYKPEFVNEIKNNISLFDIERSNYKQFNRKNFKFICKFIECYKSNEKIIFVFEKFETTLRNEMIKKKEFKIEEIKCFLLKLNEMIKYFANKNIQEIIFSKDTIAINRKDELSYYCLIIYNLFPYHKLKNIYSNKEFKNNSFPYISSNFPLKNFSINSDILKNSENQESYIYMKNLLDYSPILWNIGVLIYELYFGELPFEKDDKERTIKLKKSKCEEFDSLIEDLLSEENKRIKWKDYLKHKFFLSLKPEEVFKIILNKNIEISDKEIDLYENNIDNHTLGILLSKNFNNLIILNLADNIIENIELSKNNKDIFNKLKFMNLENNKMEDLSVDVLKALSNLEYLFLANNNINNFESFKKINLSNLNYLSFAHNNITDFSGLSQVNLNNLNVLNLSFNKIKNISCLEKMEIPYLEELKLNNNDIISIDVLEKIKFPGLKLLDLKFNRINNIDILKNVNFPELEILNLSNNNIGDINTLRQVSFKETLKELYLSSNPIYEFNFLNLTYFPSLEELNILSLKNNKVDQLLKILSIKLRLYGYTLKNQNNNDTISILIVPFDIRKSEIWDNKSFDYRNSFKIIVNNATSKEEIINYFLNKVLEMDDSDIIQSENFITFKLDPEDEISNYSILSYIDNNEIISEKNKINTLYLIKQYEKKYMKKKYHKIPYYINSITSLYSLNEICPFKIKKEKNYYNKNIVDDTESFSSFLKENNYYDKLPIIFINTDYYEGLLKFLNKNPKYEKYKNKNSFKKLLINSKEKYKYNHFSNENDNNIIADIVENIDFYSLQNVIEIIDETKKEIKGNYRETINNWIITVFEIINECFLFVLNIKLCYDICPCCNSPILYIYDNNINNDNISININNNSSKIINNEELDSTLFKSIEICNHIFQVISHKFNTFSIMDNKKIYFGDNPKIYHPANPPKKDSHKFINIIYHDENHNNNYFTQSINKDAIELRKVTNGTFIFSNSEESFRLIIKGIKKYKNDDNIKFILITTGSTFEKIYNILNQENSTNLIYKSCIYCLHKNNHIDKLDKYPNFLNGIYTSKTEVKNFILENSSENYKIFEVLKLVTYKDYINEYYKLHEIISKNYKSNKNEKTYNDALSLLQNFINQENYKIKGSKLFEGLKTFLTNDGEKIIYEYSNDTIYKDINNWLLNLNNLAYEKSGYFIGQLMYKLNEYGNENNLGYKENKSIKLYRGIYINYLDALSYQIHKGKKICFQTFLSTSKKENTAKFFSYENRRTIAERKEEFKFSLLMEIEHSYKEGLFPLCFYISNNSKYKNEEEFLFHPYTFFKIKDFSVDYEKYLIKLYLETINKKEILEEKINENNKIYYSKEEKIIEIKEKTKTDNESEKESD